MQGNKVIEGLIYSNEMGHYVDIKEYLQHAMSLINDRDPKFELSYVQRSDENNTWFEPYIRVYTKHTADEVLQLLTDGDVEARIDVLEQDDGDEYPGGPPIMLKRYSVELVGIKLEKALDI